MACWKMDHFGRFSSKLCLITRGYIVQYLTYHGKTHRKTHKNIGTSWENGRFTLWFCQQFAIEHGKSYSWPINGNQWWIFPVCKQRDVDTRGSTNHESESDVSTDLTEFARCGVHQHVRCCFCWWNWWNHSFFIGKPHLFGSTIHVLFCSIKG